MRNRNIKHNHNGDDEVMMKLDDTTADTDRLRDWERDWLVVLSCQLTLMISLCLWFASLLHWHSIHITSHWLL